MELDVKKIETWEVPECDGAPLLVMPNVPQGLFGLAPRTIMGQSKWNLVRKKACMEHNYTCQISGKYLGHGVPHIHECYEYDFKNAKAEFKRLICIDPQMHHFIHSGRLLTLFKNKEQGALTKMQMLKIAQDGFALIDRWNRNHPDEEPLRVSATFLEWAKNPELKISMEALFEAYNVKFAEPYVPKRWPIWKLTVGDKEYESPYKSYEMWQQKFSLNGRVDNAE